MKPFPRLRRSAFAASMIGLLTLVTSTLAQAPEAASARTGKSSKAAKDFQYSVSDCLESDRQDSVGLIVSEDSVAFNQVFTMNCTAATRPNTVKVIYSKKVRDLEVRVSLQSSVLSDCTCPIAIDGNISNLGKGSYRLFFVYESKMDGPSNEKPIRQSLGSKEFTLN